MSLTVINHRSDLRSSELPQYRLWVRQSCEDGLQRATSNLKDVLHSANKDHLIVLPDAHPDMTATMLQLRCRAAPDKMAAFSDSWCRREIDEIACKKICDGNEKIIAGKISAQLDYKRNQREGSRYITGSENSVRSSC